MSDILVLTFAGSPFAQRVGEAVARSFDTLPWGVAPSGVSMVVTNSAGTDVTSTVASGSINVVGNIITLKVLTFATKGQYRALVTFTANGNVFKPDFFIQVVE